MNGTPPPPPTDDDDDELPPWLGERYRDLLWERFARESGPLE